MFLILERNTYVFYECFTDKNECSVDKGGCDHVCINNEGSWTCKCFAGYYLIDDKKCSGRLNIRIIIVTAL